jgi:hypothetical protein
MIARRVRAEQAKHDIRDSLTIRLQYKVRLMQGLLGKRFIVQTALITLIIAVGMAVSGLPGAFGGGGIVLVAILWWRGLAHRRDASRLIGVAESLAAITGFASGMGGGQADSHANGGRAGYGAGIAADVLGALALRPNDPGLTAAFLYGCPRAADVGQHGQVLCRAFPTHPEIRRGVLRTAAGLTPVSARTVAWRRRVRQFHPGGLCGSNATVEMIKAAERALARVNLAHDRLRSDKRAA